MKLNLLTSLAGVNILVGALQLLLGEPLILPIINFTVAGFCLAVDGYVSDMENSNDNR